MNLTFSAQFMLKMVDVSYDSRLIQQKYEEYL